MPTEDVTDDSCPLDLLKLVVERQWVTTVTKVNLTVSTVYLWFEQ